MGGNSTRWALGLLIAAALSAAASLLMFDTVSYARIATAYAAKQTCSCLNLGGRPLASCLTDFPEDARKQIAIIPEGAAVRAEVLGGAVAARARYTDGFGCTIEAK